jgi:hypothetical protein
MNTTVTFLDELQEAAERAAIAEKNFRREAIENIKLLECERAYAFRRLNFVRAIAEGIKHAENSESAIASALDILRSRLGWSEEHSDATSLICDRFAPVAQTIFATIRNNEEYTNQELARALAAFESWYSSTHATPFWVLLEHPMMDTPRVDF